MSSLSTFSTLSPSQLKKIRSLVDEVGYGANSATSDQSNFNTTALLVMKPLTRGETSPHAQAARLEHNFDQTTDKTGFYKSQLPHYAIQGLPRRLRKLDVDRARTLLESQFDIQAWENEGGAVNTPRARPPFPSAGWPVRAV